MAILYVNLLVTYFTMAPDCLYQIITSKKHRNIISHEYSVILSCARLD